MKSLILAVAACALYGVSASAQSEAPKPADARVESVVHSLTLEEKIDYIGGTGFAIRAVPRLHLPQLEMSDGPLGVRSNSRFPSTVYAAGIGLAATWNPKLAERVGEGIGRDARARSISFMLGPGVNIYRSPRNGRNFEYFGEDPMLASQIAVGYIIGIQKQGVSATIKHYLANNSEFLRHDSDSIVDERTLREIYLPAFEAAVKKAHVGAVMDSYNFINGAHATQNAYFNTEILRKQWGFGGILMSDWRATYDGVAAANGGLDLEMPRGEFMNRASLLPAVEDGRVRREVIDEKIRHIVGTAERFGWLDGQKSDAKLSKYDQRGHEAAVDAARESIVLLKNERAVLPLDPGKIRSILVVGPNAYPAQAVGGGSGAALPFSSVSILEGVGHLVDKSATVYYEPGLRSLQELVSATEFQTDTRGGSSGLTMETFDNDSLTGTPKSTQVVKRINNAGFSWDSLSDWEEVAPLLAGPTKAASHRWRGCYTARESGSYEIVVQGAGENNGFRLFLDNRLLFNNWDLAKAYQDHAIVELLEGAHQIVVEDVQRSHFGGRLRVAIAEEKQLVTESARRLAGTADAVVVAVGFTRESEGEGADRTFGLPFGQEALIREMASENKNIIVGVNSGGAVDGSRWIEKVPAYLELWYPGEQGGTAFAEILFGLVNPSGRLPITFERNETDNPSYANYYPEPGTARVAYKEGIFVGYRGYERGKAKPLFPFGFGLSYTTFGFANLSVRRAGASELGKYVVSVDITNTGKRAGAEVAQLYVSAPGGNVPRPAKELKGFVKVNLNPGQTQRISIPLDPRSFEYFDADQKQWRAPAGTYGVLVGDSSEGIRVRGEVRIEEALTEQP